MVGLLARNDWGVGHQREVDTRVGYQVSLRGLFLIRMMSYMARKCCYRLVL